MTLHIRLGRSGSGKTSRIMDEIRFNMRKDPLGPPLLLIVPEQSTFQAEYELFAGKEGGGSLRAQVLSFHRLAYRVMQETGGSALTAIGDEGKRMLLYRLLRERRGDLRLFGASSEQPGFIAKLNDLYTELKRYKIDSGVLEEHMQDLVSAGHSPLLREKLEDALPVYRDFESRLSELYVDSEDTLIRLARQLGDSSLVRNAEIWIDGFYGFTPREYEVIGGLLNSAKTVVCTLTLDRPYDGGEQPGELDLFHQTGMTYRKLRQLAEALEVGCEVELAQEGPLPRFETSPLLGVLESRLRGDRRAAERAASEGARLNADGELGITLHAADNRRAEADAAAREMLRLAREKGARYRDMAVFVRNLDDYEAVLAPVLEDYGIPVFTDRRKSVLHHPLAEFVRAALDVVQYRWRYEDVFRCVKTDLLLPENDGITRDDMDRLENFVLASGIRGTRWTDGRPWRDAPKLSLDDEGRPVVEEEEADVRERMERLEACRDRIAAPLAAFEHALKTAGTARAMCEAVYLMLEAAEVPQRLDRMGREAADAGDPLAADVHRQIWSALLDLLDQIAELIDSEEVSVEEFAGMLETGIAGLTLGLVPPALDRVLLGDMERTRPLNIKYAFVLGLNDGIVPLAPVQGGLLSEPERTRLAESGLELSPGSERRMLDERLFIYHTLTAASHKLWLSYALGDDEDKPLLPSEIVLELRAAFPFVGERRESGLPAPGMAPSEYRRFVTLPESTLPHLLAQLRLWKAGTEIDPLWWDVLGAYQERPEWDALLRSRLASLVYTNKSDRLTRETSMELYGRKLRSSVSRMEKFTACAFSHFASHGLRLKERQLYKLNAPDIGQLFHAALSDIATRLRLENRSWGSLTVEECLAEARSSVDKIAPRLQGEILFSTSRYGYISRKLMDIVGRASIILGEHARRGDFEPLGIEVDFGPGKDIPPLVFELGNGCTMEIVGRIDRVDVAEGEEGLLLRVIDYKSSDKDLKLHEVYYGLSLQMLTYLDVLLTHAEEWIGAPALPAGTLYFHVQNPLLASPNGMTRDAAAQEMLKRFKMKGLVLADPDVVAKMDRTLTSGQSPVIPVAVKKDGGFYSSSAVADPRQWESLLKGVRRNIAGIGRRITDGESEARPYRIQQEKACDFCPYHSVCQFDESLDHAGYNHLNKPGKDRIWELFGEADGEDEKEESL
ncbi:helicase-exonuclease AddAB subunit AddB [Saccharibacillus alkalitolerans]|uniref:ATP-dependent helicase/deoxyribonuclease subunit B n=1 Tax=Saccharibacillus alkalitolerans TaxID=2705290 RepID=A0ABX0F2H2_9BACL|nr:helicase-exonuclease AddAB subunit AddB [Saccharibacillus alkalitolerans]NGZ73829.1 helicase-exonuclease AddAB subunit AddB [Saccharibacillus alkalitolerans]